MNKLTITEKVFVPMKVTEESVKDIYGVIGTIAVEEKTNKYILSKEQLEKVISDAFVAGVNREYQERNYERRDYDAPIKEQYINLIL